MIQIYEFVANNAISVPTVGWAYALASTRFFGKLWSRLWIISRSRSA